MQADAPAHGQELKRLSVRDAMVEVADETSLEKVRVLRAAPLPAC